MTGETYRGVVRGGIVVFLGNELPLTEGTEVLVTPLTVGPGTASVVLAAVQAPPHVPAEWVDELEQRIAAGRSPPSRNDPFADEEGCPEAP